MEIEFKKWLEEKFVDSPNTVSNRISNCKNIEKSYGDLDVHYLKDRCESIVNDLNYTVEDERNNVPQRHKIPINGNIRNGSATLKQALKLYIDYKNGIIENEIIYDPLEATKKTSEESNTLNKLLLLLSKFEYQKKYHEDISVLQYDITEYLKESFCDFDWEMEYKPSSIFKDSVDIYGQSNKINHSIVIELDTHRADQIAKKFVSRTALFIEKNIVYLSICYPGTKKMPKNECEKYFKYCSVISEELSGKMNSKKLFAGYIF